MDRLHEKIQPEHSIVPQLVNTGITVNGIVIDRINFYNAVISASMTDYIFSTTDSYEMLVKAQECDTVDGSFTDVAGVTETIEMIAQQTTIVLDRDLEASNTIDLKVDGVSMTQVAYNASHSTTMGDIVTQFNTDFPTLHASQASRTLTIIAKVASDAFVISDFVVASGSNQAVGTITNPVEKSGESIVKFAFNIEAAKRFVRPVAIVTFTGGGSALNVQVITILGDPKIKPVS